MKTTDVVTIVAVATPPGEGGVAVVRLSGPAALSIADEVFRGSVQVREMESHRAHLGLVCWPASPAPAPVEPPAGVKPGDPIDEVICLPLLAPRSYTGEDTVELQCHGGRVVAGLIVSACMSAGAKAAGPGEFTRRAFLNGRISLDQAEAVADLIHAEDTQAARASLAQLRGGLRRELAAVERPLLGLLADLEGSLEFADGSTEEFTLERVESTIVDAMTGIDGLLATAPAGRLLREGVQVALVGPPNVGKSSLFNALLGFERALVDGAPGTTRDVVSAPLHIDGRLFVLHDTAGLRDGGERVEALGIERARSLASQADIVLDLREAGARAVAGAREGLRLPEGSVAIEVLTKADRLDPDARAELAGARSREAFVTSSRDGSGLAELRSALSRAVSSEGLERATELGAVLNQRHQQKLMDVRTGLVDVLGAMREGAGEEVVASLLAPVMSDLGEISGRVFSEALLGEIFGRFCVGK